MIDLSKITALSADFRSKTACLSPDTQAVLFSAYEYLRNCGNWIGVNPDGLTDGEIDQIDAIVSGAMSDIMSNCMLGTVVPFITDAIPENMLLCDGSHYLAVDYPFLNDVIASALKDVDGFYVPDLRGKFLLGVSISHAELSTGGEENHFLTEEELPPHYHTYSPTVTLNVDLESPGLPDIQAAGINPLPSSTSIVGSGTPHNNMPPFIAVRYGMIAR